MQFSLQLQSLLRLERNSLCQIGLLLTLLFGSVHAQGRSSYAQYSNVTLNSNNKSVEEVLEDIQRQTSYKFIYKNSDFDFAKKVSINVQKQPLEKVLDKLFVNMGVDYQIVEKQIVLKRKAQSNQTKKQASFTDQGRSKRATLDTVMVRGRVLDQKEPPGALPGVTAIIKGTQKGAITDVDGYFELLTQPNDTIVFTFVGFVSKEYLVKKSEKNLTISLAESQTALNEVVVTGFSEQKVKYLASSVSTVTMNNVNNKPITQLSQALQGGTTGINVAQGSGLPGGDAASIKIRGVGSLLGSSPLVIVDGVPFDMDKLDPNTIESISILKDAAAASIYGARAGNGVILVTTKRGVAGKVDVQYNVYYGNQTPMTMPDFVDAPTYMTMVNEAQKNTGGAQTYSQEAIDKTRTKTDPLRNPDTNWGHLLLKKNSLIQQHGLSVAGGNSTARFSLAANYLKQDGMLEGTGFNRGTVRANTSIDLRKNFVVFMDLFASRDDQKEPYGDRGLGTARMLELIYSTPPNIVSKYPSKSERPGYTYYGTYGESWNPVAQIERGGSIQRIRDEVLINLRPKWDITRDLTLKGQFSYRVSSGADKRNRDAYVFFDYYAGTKVGIDYTTIKTAGPTNRSSYYYAGGNLDYNKTFGNHRINLIAGYSQELNNADAWKEIGLISFFGKMYYSLNDKYLVEVGMRQDGSSLFAPGKKWGNFPSFALGWNVNNEAFLKDFKALNLFKLRASYGMLGNNNIDPYKYQSTVNAGNGLETVIGNPNITWEKVAITDIGADLSFFKKQIDFTFDWYNKKTHDLILSPQPTYSSGLLTGPINIGSLKNVGLELKVGYNKTISKDMSFSVNLGYSRNQSTWLKLSQETPIIAGNNIRQVGQAATEYFGYKSAGLLQQSDLDNGVAIIPGQQAGDIRYLDLNNDGVINNNDRTLLGATDPISTFFGNLSFNVKNFDFEALVTGTGKVAAFYTGKIAVPLNVSGEGGTPLKWHQDYWTPENTDARFPRLLPSPGNNSLLSDYWQVNGAFARVKYVQIGYNLPAHLTNRIHIRGIRVYVNAQNPLTLTRMEVIDPETKGDQSTYPIFKTNTIGLNIKF